jgi:hypothetical protein
MRAAITKVLIFFFIILANALYSPPPAFSQVPARTVLFVVGNTTLSAADTAIRNRLGGLGYAVTVVLDSTATSGNATDKSLVLISSTSNSANVNQKFRTVAVPVLNNESHLLDDLGMTSTVTGTDFGVKASQSQLRILNSSHPMAGDLSGTVTVSTATEYTWGKPSVNAIRIAGIASNTAQVGIFGYEKGSAMVGLNAPARRVGFFFSNITASASNANGFLLFDQAVNWAVSVPPCTSTQADVCRETLTLESDAKLYYYRTYALGAYNPLVTKAVIVIHGTERNPLAAFTQILNAAKATNNTQNTIVLAPHFPIKEDTPPTGFLYWNSNGGIDHGWKQGDDAISPNTMSSFTVADRIFQRLNDAERFPNLRQLTVVGHSGGGQFTQKYALGGKQHPLMRSRMAVHYIPTNAGSYTYLNRYRPNLNDKTYQTWFIPNTTCPYNSYKYGLENRNNYMDDTPADTLIQQYVARRVTYLLGDQDTARTGAFDNSCQADLQGLHRFERGTAFYSHMSTYYPQNSHKRVVVPGVAHSSGQMYSSAEGRATIFPAN